MLIDWFTVIAQIINFLILVYLLKRFLYKPILEAVDARKKRITAQLEEAANEKVAAEAKREQYEQMQQELDQKKEKLLQAARSAAKAERQRLAEAAKQEYAELRKKLEDSLAAEQLNLDIELKRRAQREVFQIARQVLADLSGAGLESQITEVFLEKLKNMSREQKEQFRSSFSGKDPVLIRSAFGLAPEKQKALTRTIKDLLGLPEEDVKFLTAPEEVGGIELASGGFKISWTIAEYLNDLEKRVAALTKEAPGYSSPTKTTNYGQ